MTETDALQVSLASGEVKLVFAYFWAASQKYVGCRDETRRPWPWLRTWLRTL